MCIRERNRFSCAMAMVVLLVLGPAATGQELSEPSEQQRAEHLSQMKKLAASIRLYADPRQVDSEAELAPEPVLRYTDNTRLLYESSLWIWTVGKRPAAVLAVEYYPKDPRGPSWLYEIASLSPERISARREKGLAWTAKEPGLRLQVLDDAEPAANKPARRLAQMKDLRRRFLAHEKAPVGGRIELRPLNSPLHRYSDAEGHLIDGAIFAFANGTNPEVLLVLEAHANSDSSTTWQYGLAQMTGAAVVVQLDEKQVWSRDEADPPAVRASYINGWITDETK